VTEAARKRDVRTFTTGAACGFLAGVLSVCIVAWQLGRVSDVPAARAAAPGATAPRSQPREPVADDARPGVLEEAPERPESTLGKDRPTPTAPETPSSIGPTPGSPGELSARHLEIPVEGVRPDQLSRQFSDKRGTAREHEALDILAPRNTPVRAVENGRIARLFFSKAGGITVYQFDPSERYCYYYAHLERYADGLHEGDTVTRGQILGYVGTSGNAPKDTPHLHFAVFRLTDQKHWWEGTPIDPYDVLR
jgi:murein DD-endopeptidase MepM/ murein hydrolase activator NlpD